MNLKCDLKISYLQKYPPNGHLYFQKYWRNIYPDIYPGICAFDIFSPDDLSETDVREFERVFEMRKFIDSFTKAKDELMT